MYTSTKLHCYLCKSHLLELFDLKSLPTEYRLCCKCRSLIEILATNGFNYGNTCTSIDLIVDLINYKNEKIRKYQLTKTNKELFKLFKRISLQEKEDIKNKLRKYFFTMK